MQPRKQLFVGVSRCNRIENERRIQQIVLQVYSSTRCKRSWFERRIQLSGTGSIEEVGVRVLKKKGAYSSAFWMEHLPQGVRECEMKGAYSINWSS